MPDTVAAAPSSKPVHSLDIGRPRTAKATLDRPASSRTGAVVKDALQRYFVKLEVAARAMQMDPSQLTRELQKGDFKLDKLDRLEADAKAFVFTALRDAHGAVTPQAQARRLIRDTRALLDDLAEIVA